MPKFEYRFDLAAILLASVLTVLGMSAAQAGSKTGASGGSGATASAAPASERSGDKSGSGFTQNGGKAGGVVGSRR